MFVGPSVSAQSKNNVRFDRYFNWKYPFRTYCLFTLKALFTSRGDTNWVVYTNNSRDKISKNTLYLAQNPINIQLTVKLDLWLV